MTFTHKETKMELTIEQLRELICPTTTTPSAKVYGDCDKQEHHGICIAIADRGHVFVGRVSTSPDWVTVTDASAIRQWGTTRGLGEIAEGGPTAKTVLDKCYTVKIARRALIALIPCKEGTWKLL